MDVLEFEAELWIWDARRADTWTFVTVPPGPSEQIREAAAARPPAGFGSVRVEVTIGRCTWRTSVFPDGDRYALPVKRAVRRAEGLRPEDRVGVRLTVLVEPP